jgi:phosphotriesterase-related protein
MTHIPSVTGETDTSDLGPTLMHEHFFVVTPEVRQNFIGDNWDEAVEMARAVARIQVAVEAGVRTIVDVTPLGLGRYIPRIQQLAAQVDVNIVVATGLFTHDLLPFYWQRRPVLDGERDLLTDLFVRDITVGIADTGVRAAIIKCSTHDGVSADQERLLRAAARAHRETGAPITTHTNGAHGNEQQDIFASEGVDLTRVIIGHSDLSQDFDYVRSIMDRGSFVGLDTFGLEYLPPMFELPFQQRVDFVVRLCEAGYADRMLLSHDSATYSDCFGPTWIDQPNSHYAHIHLDVLPALRERAVPKTDITTMTVDNPRRVFENAAAY